MMSAQRTRPDGMALSSDDCRARTSEGTWPLYQRPTRVRIAIAASAAAPNQAMLRCPFGTTMNAASSGPVDAPALPPTWNNDWANPWRPPDASRATRDDSGWKMDDPMPTSATATRMMPKAGATDSSSRPRSVKPMPIGSEYGFGFMSVNEPITGCSSDAV